MGYHVPLQHGRGAEDLAARGAGVVLLGVNLVDVLAVILQSGEAHPTFLAVIGIFYVWIHERTGRRKKHHRQHSVRSGLLCKALDIRLFRGHVRGRRLQGPQVGAAVT